MSFQWPSSVIKCIEQCEAKENPCNSLPHSIQSQFKFIPHYPWSPSRCHEGEGHLWCRSSQTCPGYWLGIEMHSLPVWAEHHRHSHPRSQQCWRELCLKGIEGTGETEKHAKERCANLYTKKAGLDSYQSDWVKVMEAYSNKRKTYMYVRGVLQFWNYTSRT